jgi:DNA-binding NarL/FixJ family response regulator
MSPDHQPTRVVLATSTFLVGEGLASLLADVAEVEVVGRALDHDDLVRLVDELAPDAVIIGIRTPFATTTATLDAVRRLRLANPRLAVVAISNNRQGLALELLRPGASGVAYLIDERLTDIEGVLGALRQALSGETVLDPSVVDQLVRRRDALTIDDLNPREMDVLEQIAHGASNSGIRAELNISVKAVERSVTAIFRKLGLTEQPLIDRRVMAALVYWRAEAESLSAG